MRSRARMETPVDTVNAVFAALNVGDWAVFTDLCDPVSLRAFKREIFEQATGRFSTLSFDMPDLGEYPDEELADGESSGAFSCKGCDDPAEILKSELVNVTSLAELRRLDPGRVFSKWIQARARDRDCEEFFDPATDQVCKPRRFAMVQPYDYTVLGFVQAGVDVAHVVYQADASVQIELNEEFDVDDKPEDETELDRVLIASCYTNIAVCRRQGDGSWRLVAARNLYLMPTPKVV